jgi:hypothetical protein
MSWDDERFDHPNPSRASHDDLVLEMHDHLVTGLTS